MGNELGRTHHNLVRKGIVQRDTDRVRQLLESGNYSLRDSVTLEMAFQQGEYEMVELLLNYGTFPKNRKESRVLDLSVWKTKNDIAELLIENGYDVNGRNQFGETLLYVAACANNAIMTHTLIKLGLNVDETTRNWTPLHVAAQRNHTDIIRVLLWSGCDTEIRNSDSETAFNLTVSQYKPCSLTIVYYFLEAGAHVSFEDLTQRQVDTRAPEIYKLAQDHVFCVKPLTDLCRLVIRRRIARRIPERALSLPLPKFLQYFVRMDEVFVSDMDIS